MPAIAPNPASPADTVSDVLNAARVRLNDVIKTLSPTSGNLLQNNSLFSQQAVNNGWRRLQEALAQQGYTPLKQEQIIFQIPAVATVDPGLNCWIDWFNCYDGVSLYQAPVLPLDLIVPLKVWERPSGQNAIFPRNPMELQFDGLPSRQKQTWNGMWEWRGGQIVFPGAQQVMDFRVLYSRSLPDFADVGNLQWFQIPVPLVQSQDAFSLFICAEIAGQEDMDAAIFTAAAETAAKKMVNREIAMKQRGNVRRQSRSGRLEGCSTYGD